MSFPSLGMSAFSNTYPSLEKQTLNSPFSLERLSPNTFHKVLQIEDIIYYVVITDENDSDGDGYSDLVDSITNQAQSH